MTTFRELTCRETERNFFYNIQKELRQVDCKMEKHWKTSFEKTFFCVGNYAEDGFDQKGLNARNVS